MNFFADLISPSNGDWTDKSVDWTDKFVDWTVKSGHKESSTQITNSLKDYWSSNSLVDDCSTSVSEYSCSPPPPPTIEINLHGEIPKTLQDLGFADEYKEKCVSSNSFDFAQGFGEKHFTSQLSQNPPWFSDDIHMKHIGNRSDKKKGKHANRGKFGKDLATGTKAKRPCSEHVRLKLRAQLLERQNGKVSASNACGMLSLSCNKITRKRKM